ncbi:MAG: UvrD-helicase domain-containing protein [Verrucomicrobiota bacterium]
MPPESVSSTALVDRLARDRFANELDRSFSVIAAAGVGKTTAIVQRVVNLARADQGRDNPVLPRLAVVTYGHEAANEMRRRAADALHQAQVGPEVLGRFQQAFFGTIHSFCLELMRSYGPLAGLSPRFEPVRNEEDLWRAFLRGSDTVLHALPESSRSGFERLASFPKALSLAREFGARIPEVPDPGPVPAVDFSPIRNFEPAKRKPSAATQKSIDEGQRLAQQWIEAFNDPSLPPCPPPDYAKGGKEFQEVWQAAWHPLKVWLGDATLFLAANLAREFRAFRIERNQIAFDDMIALAAELLDHPSAGPAIRAQERLVILDEAQDTDHLQFQVLLNVAGAEWGKGSSMAQVSGPPPGRFCMVGDPQQAIYSSRADLATYRMVHRQLIQSRSIDELSFTVTMRCDHQIVNCVNQFFPNILRLADETDGQARFAPLNARPWAGPGNVERVILPPDSRLPEKPKVEESQLAEVRALAQWFQSISPNDLGVGDWHEVCLLASRNAWLGSLAEELERVGLPVQAHSRSKKRGEDPVWAWTTAIIRILAEPEDAFEVAGFLREVFVISDDAIARYIKRYRKAGAAESPLSLIAAVTEQSEIADALRCLKRLYQDTRDLPLGDALDRVFEVLDMHRRWQSIPEMDELRLVHTIDRLRTQALIVEEQGLTMADWSRQLLFMLEEPDGTDEPKPGYIQLMTCHKAKGLQWPVVVAPFLYRELAFRQVRYPVFYPEQEDRPARVAYDKFCFQDLAARKKQKDDYERERLAYVTWTRARQRLILVDGSAYYARVAESSWVHTYRAADNGANAQAWVNIPLFEETTEISEIEATDLESLPASSPFFLSPDEIVARTEPVAATFTRRIIPSSLADHSRRTSSDETGHERDEREWDAEPGYPEVRHSMPTNSGAEYGNWWHETMQHAPWGQDADTWETFLRQSLEHSPDSERGDTELTRLRQSKGFGRLNEPSTIVRTEVPILWPEGAVAPSQAELDIDSYSDSISPFAYDGYIDLLAFNEEHRRWLVVDWKTDRVGADPTAEMLGAYGQQLAAYVTALSTAFGVRFTGYLYSTRAAEWIRLPAKNDG